jgi:hypothetical protein
MLRVQPEQFASAERSASVSADGARARDLASETRRDLKGSLRSHDMSYDFSFSKKTISFLLAGVGFVGSMLFIAGLLVGATWKAEPNAAANVAGKQPVAASPAPRPSVAPQEEQLMAADAATPEAAGAGEAGAPGGVSSPTKQAHGKAPSVSSRRGQQPPPVPPNDDELRVVQEAEPSASATPEPPTF